MRTKIFIVTGFSLAAIMLMVWLGTFASGASGPLHGSPTAPPGQKPSQELNILNRFNLQAFDSNPWPIIVLKGANGRTVWAISLQENNPAVAGAKRVRFTSYLHIWPSNEIRIKGTVQYENIGYGRVDAPTVWIIRMDGQFIGFSIDT